MPEKFDFFTRAFEDAQTRHRTIKISEGAGDAPLFLARQCPRTLQCHHAGGAPLHQSRPFRLSDFAVGLAAIEFGGFAEVGQQTARHVLAASAVAEMKTEKSAGGCLGWPGFIC